MFLKEKPDMNLAELAKVLNLPLDDDSVKLLSSVNINVLMSLLSQKSASDNSNTG